VSRRGVVGVFGGGQASEDVQAQARELGEAVARRGWVLVNGGREAGVMRASAAGAREQDGLVVGVLPSSGPEDPRASVAPGVDVAVFTEMGEARNNVNVCTCDVAVALPGGAGTLSEAALAVKHDRPLVVLGATDPLADPIREHAHPAGSVDEAVERAAELMDADHA
jgi:uncharacterized protein (TIGR00725 family)